MSAKDEFVHRDYSEDLLLLRHCPCVVSPQQSPRLQKVEREVQPVVDRKDSLGSNL